MCLWKSSTHTEMNSDAEGTWKQVTIFSVDLPVVARDTKTIDAKPEVWFHRQYAQP